MAIKVKKIIFNHLIDNRLNTAIGKITGYGNINFTQSSQLFQTTIVNPIGAQEAVFYKTGILSGIINPGSGSFTWENFELSGIGEQGRVFANFITGYKQASNTIEFINSTGSGLRDGDIINIANFSFVYTPVIVSLSSNIGQFNSPRMLINILNSGATGGFNNVGYSLLQNSVGITGFLENNRIRLFSLVRSGEDGNNIRIFRTTQNLNAVKISSRYFTGGESFRPLLNNWTGNFYNNFNFTIENSGIYTRNIGPTAIFSNISGIFWINNFDNNYTILTGLKDPRNPGAYSGTKILYNTNINKYSGECILPKNTSIIYTGLNIEIIKPNPFNVSGNIAKYILSGNNFVFSGNIEG